MKTKSIICSIILVIGVSQFAVAQKNKPPKGIKPDKYAMAFDRLFEAEVKPDGPGMAILIAKNGKAIYRRAIGKANLEHNIDLKPEHVFRIGSITKQFTAVSIMQLIEQGKLSPEDDITKFIPDYPTHGNRITVAHLIHHTSGIQSYTDMTGWDAETRKKDFTVSALVDYFKNEPMEFLPGEQWNYNNSGYILLGFIIEKVSGMTYGEYLQKNIFTALGMKHSYYDNAETIIPNRAQGYAIRDEGVINAPYLSMTQPYAAGSILSTVDDMLIWNNALMSGKVISKASLEKALIPATLNNGKKTNYAYGLIIGDLEGSKTIEHSGGINGFLSNGIYFPQEDVYIIGFSNSEGQPPSLTVQMGAVAIDKPFEYAEIKVDPKIFSQYTGLFTNDVAEKRRIFVRNDSLFSQRGRGSEFHLKFMDKDKVFFTGSASKITFNRNEQGVVDNLSFKTGTSEAEIWTRIEEIAEEKKEYKISPEELPQYIGKYELQESFAIRIYLENTALIAQATAQPPFELVPLAKDRFYPREVDAEIEFVRDEQNKIIKLVLNQGGRKMEMKKVE
ncbi:MAG: serine hydrolase [Saprospiraceae bacterium]|nr:serine hydrolase [Saprospiraceae bacterium]